MSEPRASAVQIARAISNVAIRYGNTQYIAAQVAPLVTVDKEEGKFFIYDQADMFRDDASNDRAPGSRAPRSGHNVSDNSYVLKERAHAHPLPRRINENADDPLRPFETAAGIAMDRVLIRNERAAAAAFFTTGVWGSNPTPTKWDDFSSSDPAKDMSDQKEVIRQATGRRPNQLTIGSAVLEILKLHPDGLDRFKHTRAGVMTLEMIAQWLDIERIIVGEAIYTTSAEGATFASADIWGKHALLQYVPSAADINSPSAAYTFMKRLNSRTGGASDFGIGAQTRAWYEEAEDQDVVEASVLTDHKVTSAASGAFFYEIVN